MELLKRCSMSASLLFGLVLLLGVSCTIEGSVRPASVANIREVLVWGSDRDIRREIGEGILLPPLPSNTAVEDESLGKSLNFIHPGVNRQPVVGRLFYVPLTRLLPATDVKVESEHTNKNEDGSPMPYVDASQFRRSNSKIDGTPENVQMTKKYTGKATSLDGSKAQVEKGTKSDKHTEFRVSKKKFDTDQDSGVSSPVVPVMSKTKGVPSLPDNDRKTSEQAPHANPPVWSHAVISDELSDPLGNLPANEEYDRSGRFTHSILYGFNTGF